MRNRAPCSDDPRRGVLHRDTQWLRLMPWLVCPSLADGAKTRSNLRDCQCGTQVWVSVALVTLVDSGTLAPRCAPCLYKKGYDPDQIIAIVC